MQIPAASAIAFGILISALNWGTLVRRRDDRFVSSVPFVGAIVLAIGLIGFETTRPYWFLAIVVDFGTLSVLLASPMIISEMWAHSDRNALNIFESTIDDRTVTIRLIKNGDCVIDISFDPPRPDDAYGGFTQAAGFVGKWRASDAHFEVSEYAYGRELRISRCVAKTYTLAESYPEGDDPSIYALDGIAINAIRLETDE